MRQRGTQPYSSIRLMVRFPWWRSGRGWRVTLPPRVLLGNSKSSLLQLSPLCLVQGLTLRGPSGRPKLAREEPIDTLLGLRPLEVHRRAGSREGKVVREHFLEKWDSALA